MLPSSVMPLHSNMFLLIRYWRRVETFSIPCFTFQYVSINTENRNEHQFRASAFTFQYVSINTPEFSRMSRRPGIFTFQYVSINTTCRTRS